MSSAVKIFPQKLPVVAICGASGTGKSKLSIDLALALNGEVINADAVQIYKGLDIATNKITESEMRGVKHHLLGDLNPVDGFHYNVHNYRKSCWNLIEEMQSPTRETPSLPILAGGTHYYIEAVLWSDFLQNKMAVDCSHRNFSENVESPKGVSEISHSIADCDRECCNQASCTPHSSWPLSLLNELPKDQNDYYACLRNLDSEAAKHLHPHDTRKLQQAILSTLAKSARDTSNFYSEPPSDSQQNLPPNRSYSPKFTNPDSLIFWLDCEDELLHRQLDARVDTMIERGLIAELERFLCIAAASLLPESVQLTDSNSALDDERIKKDLFRLANDGLLPSVGAGHWCRGILQSIGFKEFEPYFCLPSSVRASADGQQILSTAIEQVKVATRQYARKQKRWIIKRFLQRSPVGAIPVYRLDVTNTLQARISGLSIAAEDSWNQEILYPVLGTIGEQLSSGVSARLFPSLPTSRRRLVVEIFDFQPTTDTNMPTVSDSNSDMGGPPYVCSACSGRIFINSSQWNIHLHSRTHKRRVDGLRRKASCLLNQTITSAS